MSKKDEWTIRCSGHNYITLEWNEKFVFCLDNDMMYAEEMIYKIEKRTGVDFRNIKIKGQKDKQNPGGNAGAATKTATP